jgi:hypothetical protein
VHAIHRPRRTSTATQSEVDGGKREHSVAALVVVPEERPSGAACAATLDVGLTTRSTAAALAGEAPKSRRPHWRWLLALARRSTSGASDTIARDRGPYDWPTVLAFAR